MKRETLRRSQVVSTFGPGALVDFPEDSVMIAGLDVWKRAPGGGLAGSAQVGSVPIIERHLSAKYQADLYTPPISDDDRRDDVGVVAYRFPAWFVIDWTDSDVPGGRPIVHLSELERMRKEWTRKNQLPMRFVRACSNGHIDDIDWQRLVHGEHEYHGHEIWLRESGSSGELSELNVYCNTCKRQVNLSEVRQNGLGLGPCTRRRPWLGDIDPVSCIDRVKQGPGQFRLLVRHASNAYFSVVDRVISIPDFGEHARAAVDKLMASNIQIPSKDMLAMYRQMDPSFRQLAAGVDDAELFDAYQRRKKGEPGGSASLRDRELRTLLAPGDQLGTDELDSDFFATREPVPKGKIGAFLDRVLLVHRLREVVAQIGFTRLEAPMVPVDDELDLGVTLAALGLYPDGRKWLPAVENRGEGVFFTLDATQVATWLASEAVGRRWKRIEAGVGRSKLVDRAREWLVPYTLLHSLSHLLITALSLECGYAATSIRERLYVRPPKGGKPGVYGILLYTASADAEGTLGGLVEAGRKLGHFLESALRAGGLCAHDPVCSEHDPGLEHDERPLHGASCHGCLLIAEPSCERRNELLDRALVVPTVGSERGAAFFADVAL